MESQNQNPIDYLDQIAPQPQKRDFGNLKLYAIVGAAMAAIVLFLMFISAGKPMPLPDLALRLDYTLKIADKAQKTIKDGDLHSINSNYITFLNVASRDAKTELARLNIDIKKTDPKVVAGESGAKLMATLEDARLNAVFDRVYPREMDEHLTSIQSMMAKIYKETNSKKLKEYLDKTDDQLQIIQEQFVDYSKSN